ncbi:hypothetical protein [Campylobacter sp. JMF_04 NA10]|uniref:hypothetical protein n=1 Tax=Campylobacter sp. JMF_04 NA10 TaxID=2983824 RepID=UPI0022E9DA79|nr:hypothetical protein [Campylobacter sp. JMF_04 NA10]
MNNEIEPSYPFENDKTDFKILFCDKNKEFVVAVGINKKDTNRRKSVCIRWLIGIDGKHNDIGYPNIGKTRTWVMIHKNLLQDFLEILNKKDGANRDNIAKTLNELKSNEKDFI